MPTKLHFCGALSYAFESFPGADHSESSSRCLTLRIVRDDYEQLMRFGNGVYSAYNDNDNDNA